MFDGRPFLETLRTTPSFLHLEIIPFIKIPSLFILLQVDDFLVSSWISLGCAMMFWFLRYFSALSRHTTSFIDFVFQQVWQVVCGRTWTYFSSTVLFFCCSKSQSKPLFYYLSLSLENTEGQWPVFICAPFFCSVQSLSRYLWNEHQLLVTGEE